MTTGLQLAMMAGGLVALGLTLAVLALVPSQPDLRDVVRRYSATAATRRDTAAPDATSSTEKLGLWGIAHLPRTWWGHTPTKDLALMQIPLHRHYGKKLLGALTGLLLGPIVAYFLIVIGVPLPIVIPPTASIGLAILLFVAPDLDVRGEAKRAREEFTRALVAYTDLVALERAAGSGARQALEQAAQVGDSWVFTKLAEELARSRWSGMTPWDALKGLAEELDLPALSELADVVSLSKEGSQVYSILRARSESLRTAMLNDELGRAGAMVEKMSGPAGLLGMIFMAILLVPALLRVVMGA